MGLPPKENERSAIGYSSLCVLLCYFIFISCAYIAEEKNGALDDPQIHGKEKLFDMMLDQCASYLEKGNDASMVCLTTK